MKMYRGRRKERQRCVSFSRAKRGRSNMSSVHSRGNVYVCSGSISFQWAAAARVEGGGWRRAGCRGMPVIESVI